MRTPLKFGGRYVLDVCRDPPLVAERIAHPAAAVAIELVGRRLHRNSSCGQRALIRGIGIVHVHVQHRLQRLVLAVRVTQHHH